MKCRICKTAGASDLDGRCRSCRAAKTATDMGMSYGQLQSRLWALYGDQVVLESEPTLLCPVCGRLFLPRTANQKYDSSACAVKAAQAAYRKRKRTQARGAPVRRRKEPSCSSSSGSMAGGSMPRQSTQGAADMIPTPSGKGKTN